MAKKIRLDFSKVEEKSGWNTKAIAEGIHKMKVESVQETEAGDGTPMLVYGLRPDDKRYKTRLFPFYCKLQANQLWKLRDLIVAAGGTVPKRAGMVDPNAPVGKYIACEVSDETGQYAGRSSVDGTYDLSILDDEGGSEDSGDDEDEEDYDDEDADEADEDDEDEADEDDEEDEDLEALSLPELRKRAKENGIVTTGLKKDDLIEAIEEAEAEAEGDEDDEDEDDLDDEDLEDDDLGDEDFEDDEEEEEAPAPKRRAAPARKAPAKAAAKAAPKRTVRRR